MARRRQLYVSQRLRKQHWQRIKIALAFILGIIIGIAGYGILVFSPLEQVDIITGIAPNDPIEVYVKQILTDNFQKWVFPGLQYIYPPIQEPRMSMLGISSSCLEQMVLKQYPRLSKVVIQRNIRKHKLNISYSLRKKQFTWCQNKPNKCFYVDKKGIAFGINSLASTSTPGIVLDERQANISLGEQVATLQQIKYLESVFELTSQKDSPFALKNLQVNKDFSYLRLNTLSNWFILFSPSLDFSSIQNAAAQLIKDKLAGRTNSLKYIDCRYLPKIYYQ